MSNVKLNFWIRAHLLSMELVDGGLSALWSILGIGALGIVVANESILTVLVLEEDEGLNVSVFGKEFSDFSISHGERNVLNVNIVNKSSHVTSVLWLELDGDALLTFFGFGDGLSSNFFTVEAHKAISSGGVVFIEGDLQTLDGSKLLELLMKLS